MAVCDVDIDCVKVSQYNGRTVLLSNTNSSLRLQLLPWQPPSDCADTSFPSVKYTIYFRAVNATDSNIVCDQPLAACSQKVNTVTCLYGEADW